MRAAELGGGSLSHNHGAGRAQRPHGCVVALGKVAVVGRATHLRGHIPGFEEILDADRHAVNEGERTPGLPARGAGIGCGPRPAFVQGGEGQDDRFTLLDRLETALEIGAGAVSALPKPGCRVMKS